MVCMMDVFDGRCSQVSRYSSILPFHLFIQLDDGQVMRFDLIQSMATATTAVPELVLEIFFKIAIDFSNEKN